MTNTARDIIARAVMIANRCGCTVEGERAFCDDPRADPEIRCQKCDCKDAALSVIDALDTAGLAIVPKAQIDRLEELEFVQATERRYREDLAREMGGQKVSEP